MLLPRRACCTSCFPGGCPQQLASPRIMARTSMQTPGGRRWLRVHQLYLKSYCQMDFQKGYSNRRGLLTQSPAQGTPRPFTFLVKPTGRKRLSPCAGSPSAASFPPLRVPVPPFLLPPCHHYRKTLCMSRTLIPSLTSVANPVSPAPPAAATRAPLGRVCWKGRRPELPWCPSHHLPPPGTLPQLCRVGFGVPSGLDVFSPSRAMTEGSL